MSVLLMLVLSMSAAVAAAVCPAAGPGCMPSAKAFRSIVRSSADACCTACSAAAPQCKAWTFNPKSDNICYLHPAPAVVSPGPCTSGGGLPPPPPAPPPAPAPPGAKNVLMIIVDDLRPEAAIFNQSFVVTPNIDRLGKQGMVFKRAYCQQAICGPTRNSFLSGRRPQRTKSWNFENSFRQVGPNWVAFPEYFKNNGYLTLGTGKTYHPGLPSNFDEPLSWSQDEPYYFGANAYPGCSEWKNSWACPTDADYSTFSDWLDMNMTRAQIQRHANKDRPFFLAYGAHRPHLPWDIPRHFWDLYNSTEDIALPLHEAAPVGMPPIAFTYECDGKTTVDAFGRQAPIPYPNSSTALPSNMTRSLRRGYYAAVTWTDFLIGELLDAIEEAGVAKNTVVALIGDHGWQLGEHNIWGKHTNFELATRVPLIVSVPGSAPGVSNALVESVDLYPTIAAVAGLPAPPDLDGVDLSPLIKEPGSAAINKAAYSEYPRCPQDVTKPWGDTTSCVHTSRNAFTAMGYSIRTDAWRYTIWLWWGAELLQGDFSRPAIGVELYAHTGDTMADFDEFENVNVASDPANRQAEAELYAMAVAHWNVTSPAHDLDVGGTALPDGGGAGAGYLDLETRRLQYEEWWAEEP